jgi:putative tryptophan/tyrosine transport system substrate-binding protein
VLIRAIGLIAAAVCLLTSGPIGAQPASKVPRIGVLWQTSPPPPIHPHISALLKNLQDLGWHDGRTVAFEYRYAGNDAVRLDELANELVRMKVDVITTAGDLSTRAAQRATSTIPIVALVGLPVESGFAKSLSRPDGNVTGFAVIGVELSVKRLELLKELVPRLRRVAVLWDPVTHERQLKAVEAAARSLGVEVQVLRAKSESEFEAAFEAARKARAEAMLVMISPTYVGKRGELVRLAARYRMPAIYHSPAFTEVGGLIAYGPSLDEQWQKIAGAIDRILKGARAAELPFQQPTQFELDVNLKAARDIGLDIPQSILLRANKVTE